MGERKLFTPGPLGISKTTKEAMLRDVGSRETEFMALVRNIRDELVALAGQLQHTFLLLILYCSRHSKLFGELSTANRINFKHAMPVCT